MEELFLNLGGKPLQPPAPTPLRELSLKIARNAVSNAVGRVWTMAIQFILTPYVVAKLGDERFGIWAFLVVFVGYFAVFDLGTGSAVVKYVSGYYTAGDFEELNKTINSALVVMALLMGALCLVGIAFSPSFLRVFRVSPRNYSEAHVAMIGFFILMFGQGALGVFQQVLTGLQRMELFNLVAVLTSIPNALGTVFFLARGYGLRGLVYNNFVVFTMSLIATVWLVFKACPQYRFNPFMFDRKSLAKLMNFGVQMQANNLAALVCWHGDKIMIGFFLNMAKVTSYELGYRLATAARAFPSFILPAVMPAASEVFARRDSLQLQRLFELGSRCLALITFPSMMFLIFNAPLLMMAWMRESRPDAIWAARLLAIGFMVNVLGGVGTSIARGVGRPDVETRTILPYLAVNFALGIPLIIKIGFWGPLIATPIATVFATVCVFYQFHSQIKIKLKHFLQQGLVIPALASLFAAAVTLVVDKAFPSWHAEAPRAILLSRLVFGGMVFFGCYALFIWVSKGRTKDVSDWDLMKAGVWLAVLPFFRMMTKLRWARLA